MAALQQQLPLHPVTALATGAHADAAAGIDHPVPGHSAGQGQAAQGPTHLAGTAIGPDQLSNLAVGCQLSARNQSHSRVHTLIEAGCICTVCSSMPLLPRRFERIKAVLNRRMGDLTVLLEHVDKP